MNQSDYKTITHKEAIDAIFAGDDVEMKRYDLGTHPVWVPISPNTTIRQLKSLKGHYFRIRTPTINIGGHSVPRPLSTAPEEGTDVYIVSLMGKDLRAIGEWCNNSYYQGHLKRGIVHITAEAAIAHAKALIAISGGAV